MEDERARLQLDWIKVLGAALAAMSSAVLLSTLGAAGTIIGAALGSVVITAGGSVYSHYLDLSRERVARAQAAASRRVSDARTQPRGASTGLREVEQPAGPTYREAIKGLPWKRIALAAAGVFLVAMTIITVFELATGRAVSSYTGGSEKDARTSITGLVGGARRTSRRTSPGARPATPPRRRRVPRRALRPTRPPPVDPPTDPPARPPTGPTARRPRPRSRRRRRRRSLRRRIPSRRPPRARHPLPPPRPRRRSVILLVVFAAIDIL